MPKTRKQLEKEYGELNKIYDEIMLLLFQKRVLNKEIKKISKNLEEIEEEILNLEKKAENLPLFFSPTGDYPTNINEIKKSTEKKIHPKPYSRKKFI